MISVVLSFFLCMERGLLHIYLAIPTVYLGKKPFLLIIFQIRSHPIYPKFDTFLEVGL